MLKNDIERFQDENYHFENVSISENGFFNINKSMIGATLPEVTILPNYKYAKINLAQKNPSSEFLVNGWAENTIMWFTTKSEDLIGNEKIVNCSDINLDIGEDAYVSIDLMNADWLYFQFSNVDTATPKVELLSLTEIGGTSVNKLTSSLVLLADTTPSLESGFYALDSGIYIGSASPNNLVYSTGELIYYDSTSKIFYGTLKSVSLENGTWTIYQNENIENTLSNSRDKIPSSLAVYNALQNASSFYTTLNETLTLNMDGTNNLNLQNGYYLTQLVEYYDDDGLNTSGPLSNAFCYYNANDKRLALCGIQHNIYNFLTYLYFIDSDYGWVAVTHTFNNVLENSKIETNITSSSDNTKVAGAKATYDLVKANGIPEIPATTTTIDLTSLEAGLYHFNHTATINCGNNVSFSASTGRDNFLSLKPLNQNTKIFTIFNGLQTYYGSVGVSSSNYNSYSINDTINAMTYSNYEKKVGTWINGKPLYQIVKTATAPNVTTEGTFVASTTNHGIANVDTIFIDNAFDQTGTEHVNLPYSTNSGYNIKATVSTTQIAISSNATNFNGHTYLFILKYTKTTD